MNKRKRENYDSDILSFYTVGFLKANLIIVLFSSIKKLKIHLHFTPDCKQKDSLHHLTNTVDHSGITGQTNETFYADKTIIYSMSNMLQESIQQNRTFYFIRINHDLMRYVIFGTRSIYLCDS